MTQPHSATLFHFAAAFATGGLKPELSFFFEIDIEAGLQRRMQGNLEMNRMDLQKQAFYQRVAQGYQTLIAAEPSRWQIIDGNRPIDTIQAELQQIIQAKLTA